MPASDDRLQETLRQVQELLARQRALEELTLLGLLMASAVVLNLVVAAIMGVAVPIFLHATGRDPAQGASVLLTFTTDGMGFLIFLGLARLFLA